MTSPSLSAQQRLPIENFCLQRSLGIFVGMTSNAGLRNTAAAAISAGISAAAVSPADTLKIRWQATPASSIEQQCTTLTAVAGVSGRRWTEAAFIRSPDTPMRRATPRAHCPREALRETTMRGVERDAALAVASDDTDGAAARRRRNLSWHCCCAAVSLFPVPLCAMPLCHCRLSLLSH